MYDSIVSENKVPQVNITFVDAANFERLQSAHFKMQDFKDVIRQGSSSSAMSVMTLSYLISLNNYLSEIALGRRSELRQLALTANESHYTEFAVMQDMTTPSPPLYLGEQAKLCYDTLPVDDHSLIIVVQKGFLNHLADNKDNYREFVLACIRCMDRFNCDLSQLNHLYLQLQLTAAPFELLRCRIQ